MPFGGVLGLTECARCGPPAARLAAVVPNTRHSADNSTMTPERLNCLNLVFTDFLHFRDGAKCAGSWRDRDRDRISEGDWDRLAGRVGGRTDRDDRACTGDIDSFPVRRDRDLGLGQAVEAGTGAAFGF